MKKKWLLIGTVLLLSVFLLTSIDSGITGEKSSKKKGYLGVSVEELDRHDKKEFKADFGVLVSRVEIDSPADEYGLMEDDVIQMVNGVKIRRPHTLTRLIRKIKPGDNAKITVIRDGAKKTLSVVIGKLKRDFHYSFSTGGPEKKLINFFSGDRAYLGVQLRELNEDLAPYFGVRPDQGALVMEVEEDSPAEKAGLKAGDVLTKIDKEEISTPDDVVNIISDSEEDDEIEISLIRKNKKQTIRVTLEERKGYGNIFFPPNKKMKRIEIRSGKDNELIELMDDDVIIGSPKEKGKINKIRKKIKVIKGII